MDNNLNKIAASVTLYLSISLALIMSLLCYILESCHLDALICRAEGVSYTSVDSLFSNYCLPLFEDYGIFALNKQGLNMEKLLQSYVEKNCETPSSILSSRGSFLKLRTTGTKIIEYAYLTDDDGQIFADQISEHVKYLAIGNAVEELLKLSDTDVPHVFSQTDTGVADIRFDNIDTSLLNGYISDTVSRTGETSQDLTDIDSSSFLSSITKNISHHMKLSLLSCIVPNPISVSTATIDKSALPSVTCSLSETGIQASYGYYVDEMATTFEKAAFCKYVSNTFGCYTTPNNSAPLKYQMEYVISGQNTDDNNLINVANQLIALRSGLNLVHLLSNNDKYNAAWSIAQTASGSTVLAVVIQLTILTIWATAEAIIDVRDLLAGKKVPLFKNAEQWNLSIKNLLNFSKESLSVNNGTSGLSYASYLEMLLAIQNPISLRYRSMDLIQMTICHNYNENFRISQCVTGIRGKITYALPTLISNSSYTYPCDIVMDYH